MDNARLKNMYQEMILEHNKSPRNFGPLDCHTHYGHGKNPLCGDDYEFFLDIKDDVIESIGFTGDGCAISKSSASMLTTMVKGKQIGESRKLSETFLDFILNEGSNESLGKLKIFEGVKQFPVRVKCATLSWRALEQALLNTKHIASTEA